MQQHITPLKMISALALSVGIAAPACAGQSEAWSGNLYRNGGHFGDANSDLRFEASQTPAPRQAEMILAGAPSSNADEIQAQAASTAWNGTLYRNGGHYGDRNSDVTLER